MNDFGRGKFTIAQEMYWVPLRSSLGVVWGRWLRRPGGFNIFLHTGGGPVHSWVGYARTSSTEVTAERGGCLGVRTDCSRFKFNLFTAAFTPNLLNLEIALRGRVFLRPTIADDDYLKPILRDGAGHRVGI